MSSKIQSNIYLQLIKGLKASSNVSNIGLPSISTFKSPTQLTKGYFKTSVLLTPNTVS